MLIFYFRFVTLSIYILKTLHFPLCLSFWFIIAITMNPRPKIFLLIHTIALFLSLFVVIPMSISINNFKGHCLLYADGTFTLNQDKNSSSFTLSNWGNSSNCNFLLFMGVAGLLASALSVWRTGRLVWKEDDRSPFSSFLMLIGSSVIMFCLFVSALISSIGFEKFCDGAFAANVTCDSVGVDLSSLDVYTDQFFSDYHVVQFGIWCSFCTWLIGSILAFFKVYYYHKNRELMQSLANEKDTLLHRNRQYQPIDSESVISPATA